MWRQVRRRIFVIVCRHQLQRERDGSYTEVAPCIMWQANVVSWEIRSSGVFRSVD